jgi:hypothetical protein
MDTGMDEKTECFTVSEEMVSLFFVLDKSE